MANIRELDKRRKSIRNIRKITRTMELIATARFKKAMDRAAAANDYTQRLAQIVQDLAAAELEQSHPLLTPRPDVHSATILMLTSNRGLCGGYNGAVVRVALQRREQLLQEAQSLHFEVSGKRGISVLKFRNIPVERTFTQFEDRPAFEEVASIADRLMEEFIAGNIDRVDVAYTRFISLAKQEAVVETLLPLGQLSTGQTEKSDDQQEKGKYVADYEFLPSAESILQEVVPASVRARLFKCFLDAAVSEQIARMMAMKSATENAGELIKQLSMTYNRARQSKITGEIMEIIGGVEALEK